MAQSRQLSAILFTDIVGYTALMGNDEVRAFELLIKNREIHKPVIEEFNGRFIKEIGDGVMASFNTVSDAVHAAVKIQNICTAVDDFQLRFGIHQGEVVFESDDVFGDTVNIAARIQSVAKPGCIYVSESVHNNIANKKEFHTRFVKEEILKNVKEPVRIYEVLPNRIESTPVIKSVQSYSQSKLRGVSKRLKRNIIMGVPTVLAFLLLGYAFYPRLFKNTNHTASDKWVAILPFRLISGEAGMEWLSDGFTEELTSAIAGISDLKVKSPTTMMQYKTSNKSTRKIAEELNVTNIIEGSLQREGNTMIINASLINPITEEILQNYKFRKDASEIKRIYSEVAQQVAYVLNATISSEEKKKLQKTALVDPEVYNLFLKGMSMLSGLTNRFQEPINIFDSILDKDANNVPAMAAKAMALLNRALYSNNIDNENTIKQIDSLLTRSLALDSNYARAHLYRSWAALCLKWDFAQAQKGFSKSFSLDPSDDMVFFGFMFLNIYLRNYKEANKWWEIGKDISPNSIFIDGPQIHTLYLMGKEPEAIQLALVGIEKYNNAVIYGKLGWVYNLASKHNDAIEILETGLSKFNRRDPAMMAWLASSYSKSGNKIKAGKLFRELEDLVQNKSPNVAVYLAASYASIGEKKLAMNFLDIAYELHDVDLIWLKSDPHFSSLHNETRYQEMLTKVGF